MLGTAPDDPGAIDQMVKPRQTGDKGGNRSGIADVKGAKVIPATGFATSVPVAVTLAPLAAKAAAIAAPIPELPPTTATSAPSNQRSVTWSMAHLMN